MSTDNPERSTPRWQLWTLGIIGGLVVAVMAFVMGGDNPDATRQSATQFGVWSLRLLILGALVAGGWGALRRKGRD